MTPYSSYYNCPHMVVIVEDSNERYIETQIANYSAVSINPVINLEADTVVTNTSGTYNDPWVVV